MFRWIGLNLLHMCPGNSLCIAKFIHMVHTRANELKCRPTWKYHIYVSLGTVEYFYCPGRDYSHWTEIYMMTLFSPVITPLLPCYCAGASVHHRRCNHEWVGLQVSRHLHPTSSHISNSRFVGGSYSRIM